MDGECAGCRRKRLAVQRLAASHAAPAAAPAVMDEAPHSADRPHDPAAPTVTGTRPGHNFGMVQVHPGARMAHPSGERSEAVRISGRPAVGSLEDADEIFIGGPPSPPTPAPAPAAPTPSPPTPAAPPPAAKAASPADIKVAAVGTLQMDESFAKAGWLTGWGGFAQMEVSDPGGRDWAGTAIHENLTNIKNTCGEAKACSNAHGEGGEAGSTFEVGKGGEFLGLLKFPAEKNCFWDVHVIGMKGVSLLHRLGKPTCEIQCQQYYDCGGRRFGPDFIVTYLMKQDVIKSGGTSYNVTRIELNKEAKKEPEKKEKK